MHHATILLVEDDPNYALLLAFAFSENSLEVHVQQVCDGYAAIAYLQGRGPYSNRRVYSLPGLVVLDLRVPRIRGNAVLRWIRKQRWLAGLPVVLLSDEDGKNPGAETVIMKRTDIKDLIHLLQNTNLGWAINSKSVTALSQCSAMKYSRHSRQVRRSVGSCFAPVQHALPEPRYCARSAIDRHGRDYHAGH